MDELKAQWIATDAHHRGMVMMQLRKIAEQHEFDADRYAKLADCPSEVKFVNDMWGNVHNHMAAWAVEESRRYDQRSQALEDHLEVALDAADAAVVAMRRGAKP